MYKKLAGSDSILRLSDGAIIPADTSNTDYSAYMKWMEAGYAPEPSDPLPNPRRAEIVLRLSQIDSEKIRPASEVAIALATGSDVPEFSKTKLIALEAEAAELRSELAGEIATPPHEIRPQAIN